MIISAVYAHYVDALCFFFQKRILVESVLRSVSDRSLRECENVWTQKTRYSLLAPKL